MRLLTFNSLIMFDIVFIFFLFLVGLTCLMYYIPGRRHSGELIFQNDSKPATNTSGVSGKSAVPLTSYVTISASKLSEETPLDHV